MSLWLTDTEKKIDFVRNCPYPYDMNDRHDNKYVIWKAESGMKLPEHTISPPQTPLCQ